MIKDIRSKTPEQKLAEAEVIFENDIANRKDIRDKILEQELDTGFYFSVIFESKEERDEFLNKYKITLRDNYSVLSKDFINKI